jgi:hypothetical protein
MWWQEQIPLPPHTENTGCYQGWQKLSDYQLFGSFTVTIEDAKEYLYSFSKTRRVHRFQSFQVNLYI